MKSLEKLSKKAIEFCNYEGLDIEKVKKAMKSSLFAIQRCETKSEMEDEGVDFSYPYVIWNPYDIDVTE
jgi:hypothetical protein